MTLNVLPAFLPFYLMALLALVLPGRLRGVCLLVAPLASLLLTLYVPDGEHLSLTLFDLRLSLYQIDDLSRLFMLLFSVAAGLALLFSAHLQDRVQQSAGLLYAGSAIGAVAVGDLLSLFLFWEMLALTSVFLIWRRGRSDTVAVGQRYLIWQVASGVVVLAGLLLWQQQTGSLALTSLDAQSPAGWMLLLGFGLKAGFPLLHAWIPDAYPRASVTGAVFLAAFTTKTAVYVLARCYAGTDVLIGIGAVMAVFPVFFALMESDIRRILAYSMIGQIGFMVTAIGLGSALAVDGAVAHTVNDVIFKGLLFMTMGAVIHATGQHRAEQLGNLASRMPGVLALTLIGCASLAAVPLFSGFVSKTMILAALAEAEMNAAFLALMFASACALFYLAFRLPYLVFFARPQASPLDVRPLPPGMWLAMGLAAGLCLVLAIPQVLQNWLPGASEYDYPIYKAGAIIHQLQLLSVAGLVIAWLVSRRRYPLARPGHWTDSDALLRTPLRRLTLGLGRGIMFLDARMRALFLAGLERLFATIRRHYGPDSSLATTWPSGSMVLSVAIMLATLLIVALIG